jgi:hypothetical protein
MNGKQHTVIEITYYNYTSLNENPYDSAVEVSVPNDAKQYNDMLKPQISGAFGGAKLTKAQVTPLGQIENIVLGYTTKDEVNSSAQVLNVIQSTLT